MAAIERSIRTRPATPSASYGTLAWLASGLRLALAELALRRRYRADLRRLLRVGPHMIADVGLTHNAARREAEKPLWRP